jgi:hypothetical protein
MNQQWLELRWGHIIDHKMAAVHGTLCIPPHNRTSMATQFVRVFIPW